MSRNAFSVAFLLFLLSDPTCGNNVDKLYTNYRYENGAVITKRNHALLGNTISSLFLPSMLACNQKCLTHSTCVSFNYQQKSEPEMLGLCELKDRWIAGDGSLQELQYKPGYIFTQIYARDKMPLSCLDHSRNGAIRSGLYSIHDNRGIKFQVYCDLTSEPGRAWTLVMSQTFKNRAVVPLYTPLFINRPLNQKSPQWDAYRLSLYRMNTIKSASSHWRVTCNFPTEGLQYKDYVRVKFNEFDAMTFNRKASCQKVEHMNVRGHECSGCTAAWWQANGHLVHHDSNYNGCEFGSTPGSVSSEDNFGWYGKTNKLFRCTSDKSSSTNHWFGGHV